jgi:hypothetical protein
VNVLSNCTFHFQEFLIICLNISCEALLAWFFSCLSIVTLTFLSTFKIVDLKSLFRKSMSGLSQR